MGNAGLRNPMPNKVELGSYGKSANQIRNFGISIGSKGWDAKRGWARAAAGGAVAVSPSSLRRPNPLADLRSYGARWGVFARPPVGRLGWCLAADLQLVRTRGIQLFN